MKEIHSVSEATDMLLESFPEARVNVSMFTNRKVGITFDRNLYNDIYTDGEVTNYGVIDSSYILCVGRNKNKVTNIHLVLKDMAKCSEILDPSVLCMLG